MTDTLSSRLAALHDDYVHAVNVAVADEDTPRVERLVAAYDREALQLMSSVA
ncbi:hypothetical protein [Nocardioides marmoribigeumensis]|uniref:Glycine cleavage system regulatory protein n=1 Tax=Nocardioides marmoribigeumensis TaxID=433649 RepID=A0ABU2BT62_9ACTN|nr:hypothetical protein [Nocardioides marmoribigeumensis]MDR7361824.1 glycine cleavage system regulatory protein [Nocardioides marmoribigeumensis]